LYTIHKRMMAVLIIISLLLAGIGGRFFWYQVIEGPELARQASLMRSQGFSFPESGRGKILDRYGRTLTGEGLVWCCFAMTGQMEDVRGTSLEAARILSSEAWIVEDAIRNGGGRGEAFVLLASHLDDPQIINELRGIQGILVTEINRRYRPDGAFVHLLGNLTPAVEGSKSGLAGSSGIELRYEDYLQARSLPDQLVNVVDGRGSIIPHLSPKTVSREAESLDVVTTIDRRIQLIAEEAANRGMKTGAVVVLDIASRDILAMVSRPTYNPYDSLSYDSPDNQGQHLNRALTPFYPGSLFKIAVASAALNSHVLTPEEQFFCPGYYRFSDRLSIACWKEGGHGTISVARALAESCNSAFIEIGLRLGRARLLEFCHGAGFFFQDIIGYSGAQQGSKLTIDYGEAALGNASLGQQGVMMTPLQVANMVATVADDGVFKQPRLVKGISRGDFFTEQFDSGPGQQVMEPGAARLLQEYLRMAATTGTGRSADLPDAGSAGKTATSQTGRRDESGQEVLDTWFAGYFPADDPQWVIAVLVEHGQSGGYNAAPVFKEIAQGILGSEAGGSQILLRDLCSSLGSTWSVELP